MARRHRPEDKHACAGHTQDVLEILEPLVPLTDWTQAPVQPAELLDWIFVEAEDGPEVADHGWRVDLSDEVGLLVRMDRDDMVDLLGAQVGVRSVIQLDREVLVVDAPFLCADGLRAAAMRAVAAANESAHNPRDAAQVAAAVPGSSGDTGVQSSNEAQAPTTSGPSADDYAPRLVTGDARWQGRRVQIWVNQEGLLLLPAGTIPHGPLDPSDNPRYRRATFDAHDAVGLAERHEGRWVPYARLAKLRLRRPGPVRRRWTATIEERGGDSATLRWRGTRPHALLLWAYVVAKCGLDRVEGLP